jgi:hypothetical protein
MAQSDFMYNWIREKSGKAKLFSKEELSFLCNYDSEEFERDMEDRKYKFRILSDSYYVEKLLKWFEVKSGEKLKNYNYELIIHTFGVGDYFSKHKDAINIHNKNRAYVVGVPLNSDYTGGEYILYQPDEVLSKVGGVPYYFKSDRMHEITKIESGIRKSALIFIYYEDIIKKDII